MKKGQIQSELLRYILITVVVFLVIIFSIILFRNLREKQREAELIDFKEDIGSSIEVIATRVGSVNRETFSVPPEIELVCFVDFRYKDEILETPLVDRYLFIKDSLETGTKQNIFLIANDILTDAFYNEDVCFENYPYYQCVEVEHGMLDVLLEGLGDCTTIFTNYSAYISDNKRNTTIYDEIEFGGFLTEDTENHVNYRDILQIIPLAFVNSKDEYKKYPYLAYYGSISDTKIKNIMDSKGLDTIIIFRGQNYNYDDSDPAHIIIDDNLDNYLDYWETIYDVTIIDYNNDNGALIAALFTAFTNTPLIFVDTGSLGVDYYKDLLNGKTVNVVDENSIDREIIDYLEESLDTDVRYFKSVDLRIMRQNRILSLDSDIIIP